MEVSKWYWAAAAATIPFHVSPLPVAPGPVCSRFLQMDLLADHLGMSWGEYLMGTAAMEEGEEEEDQRDESLVASYSSSNMPCAACDPHSFSDEAPLSLPDQERDASLAEALGGRTQHLDMSWGKKHFEEYKSLDFEDEIFIPDFGSGKHDPRTDHAAPEPQCAAKFGHHRAHPQHVRPQTPDMVAAPLATVDHLAPLYGVIPASRRAILCGLPASQKTSPCEGDLGPHITHWLKWHYPSPLGQYNNAPQTPPSSDDVFSSPLRRSNTNSGPDRADRTLAHHAQIIFHEIVAQLKWIDSQSSNIGPSQLHRRPFIPSRAVTERKSSSEALSASPSPPLAHSSLSTPSAYPNPHTTSAKHHYGCSSLPVSQNCAIYILGIPAHATYADVLSSIRGGRVYICLIDPAVAGRHSTSAAKIVFFTRRSAEAFFLRACSSCASSSITGDGGSSGPDGIYILGTRIRAVWNRILYPPQGPAKRHQSRVLRITGPEKWMDWAFFETFLRERVEFQVEARYEEVGMSLSLSLLSSPVAAAGNGGQEQEEWKGQREREREVTHVWRFASLRAQAELAFLAVQRELGGVFRVEYGVDPCEGPWAV